MGRFGLIGPSYTSQSPIADCQMTRNWYQETIESGDGKSRKALYPTPGENIFATLGGSSVPQMVAVNGRLFAVSGTNLYEIFANGTFISRGVVAAGKVSMAFADINPTAGAPQLAVVAGGILYVLNLITNAFGPSSGPLGTPLKIFYADGFFQLLNSNGVWQSSTGLDATSWPGIESQSVSIYNDQTIAMGVVHREIWLMSALHGAVYADAGDAPEAYDLASGGDIEHGIAAPDSMVALDNTMFWLGANKDGAGMFWRASGYTPQRVSNYALEYAMRQYPTITDCICYGYQDNGHTFLVAYFPSANSGNGMTWVYDISENQWHERMFWNAGAGIWTAHRSQCHAYVFGKHLVGDWASGNIYEMNVSITTDFGNVIRRVRRAPHLSVENERIAYSRLTVDVEVGLQSSQVLPGTLPPTFFALTAPNGSFFNLGINDVGVLETIAAALVDPILVFLNDPTNATSWKVSVNNFGIVLTSSVPLNPGYPTSITMNSSTGHTQWNLAVTNIGILNTQFVATVTRNPTMMMRYSDDGGKTWSNERTADTGAVGNYKARVIYRRLGSGRDRVIELSVTDPIPWRLIEGYLKTKPSKSGVYEPSERLTDRLRKQA
jgi:hypothetical protein